MKANEGMTRPDGIGAGTRGQKDRSSADLFAEALIASYVDDPRFVPRPWLLGRVQDALNPPQAQIVLLTGEPGSGKTALMTHLARLHPQSPRYFIRRDSVTALQGGDARSFLFSVGHQLAHLRPALFDPRQLEVVVRQRAERIVARGRVVGIQVQDLQASPFYATALKVTQYGGVVEGELVGILAAQATVEPRLLELSNLQYLALLDPAQALMDQDPKAEIVVLVDALDEVRYGLKGEDVLSWLAACPKLPPNIRFVLTSRPDPDLLHSFRRAKAAELVELSIDPEGKENQEDRDRIREDLRRFLGHVAAEPAMAQALRAHEVQSTSFVEAAVDKAEGNFQYAVALARGIDQALAIEPPAEDLPALLRLEGIPSGTTELYRVFLGKIKGKADAAPVKVSTGPLAEPEDRPAWCTLYQPVLSVLAVAYQPLSAAQLQAYAALPPGGMPRALEDLAQFLDPHLDRRYRLYHATFPEFLTGDATATPGDPFHIDPGASHGLLAGRLLRANPDWLACQDRYALAYTPAHLLEAASALPDPDDREEVVHSLSRLLTDFGFLEQKTTLLDVDSVLADFRSAEGVIPPPSEPRVEAMHATVRGQAHHLRPPRPLTQPGYVLRQLCLQAAELTEDRLADDLRARLRDQPDPGLVPLWTTRRVSRAFAGELGRHDAPVRSLAVLPDGRVVSGGDDRRVLAWDPQRPGSGPVELGRHDGPVSSVAGLPDGRVVSGGDDRRVLVWDPQRPGSGPVELGRHDGPTQAVAVLHDGRVVSFDDDGLVGSHGCWAVLVWDPDRPGTGPVELCHGPRPHPPPTWFRVRSVAALPDGQVVTCVEGHVLVWDPQRPGSGPVELGRHDGPTQAVAVLHDGRVVSGGDDRRVLVWDPDRPGAGPVGYDSFDELMRSVAVLPDGQVAVVSGEDHVLVWDPQRPGSAPVELSGYEWGRASWITVVAALPDGRVAAGDTHRREGNVLVWDLDQPDSGRVVATHTYDEAVTAVTGLPDGRVVSGGRYGSLVVSRDLGRQESGNSIPSQYAPYALRTVLASVPPTAGHRGQVTAVAGLPDGRVVSGGDDQRVLVWDPKRPGSAPVELGSHAEAVRSLAVLHDGRVVSGGDDQRVLVWDPSQPGTGPVELGSHDAPVTAVAGLPDGRVVSGGDDQRVLVWARTTRTEIAQLCCSVVALATGPLGPGESALVVAHKGAGFSVWSVRRSSQELRPSSVS